MAVCLVLQRSVILILPYNPPPHKFLDLNVKGLWKDDTAWVDVGFIPKVGTALTDHASDNGADDNDDDR